MRRICLVGVRGVGKTTLINSVLSRVPWIDYLIGSNILRQLVGEDFVNFDRYPEERKQNFREQAIMYMEKRQMQTHKDILVDGHTTLYNAETGKVEGVFTELDCQFYTDLIYYNATYEVVLNRRKNDFNKRRILDPEIIKQELLGERNESIRIAKDYQMGWYEITEDAPEKMHELLYAYLSEIHQQIGDRRK